MQGNSKKVSIGYNESYRETNVVSGSIINETSDLSLSCSAVAATQRRVEGVLGKLISLEIFIYRFGAVLHMQLLVYIMYMLAYGAMNNV